jgi:hypothetical protein
MRFIPTIILGAQIGMLVTSGVAAPPSSDLRVASVIASDEQPNVRNDSVIFYEAFDLIPEWSTRFFEYSDGDNSFVWTPNDGLRAGAMRCRFEKGQVSAGSLKVLFGKNPFNRGLMREQSFREIYWRVYVKHESGWEGNPAKLARATCLASGPNWSQGLIAHVWGGKGEVLCIDPATGIRDSRKVSIRYNDFANLKWLGSRQAQTPIFSQAESGRWVCVESHVKINSQGARDGVFELFVDGKLEAVRTDIDWHGSWNDYAINAVFLENYWNEGSLKRQERWFDDFVISTAPIGPITAQRPVTVLRTGPSNVSTWELQVASDPDGKDIVWQSRAVEGSSSSLVISKEKGEFIGSRVGSDSLADDSTHWLRLRQVGQPDWSPWHMAFR